MNIKTELLPELFESVYQLLAQHNYSNKTQAGYRYTYNQLKIYLNRHGIDYFTQEIGMEFINQHYGKKASGEKLREFTDLKLRIRRLVEAHENEFLSVRRYVNSKKDLKHLKQSLDIYKNLQQERMLALKTIEAKCFQIKGFFCS